MLEPIILFALGGAGYQAIELTWRGTTHWTMFAAGGACLCLFAAIGPAAQPAVGGSGVMRRCSRQRGRAGRGPGLPLPLHLAVWDYSALWGNVAGLVCPLYSFYWFLLCFWVLLVLRGAENWTERPLYRITKWAAKP